MKQFESCGWVGWWNLDTTQEQGDIVFRMRMVPTTSRVDSRRRLFWASLCHPGDPSTTHVLWCWVGPSWDCWSNWIALSWVWVRGIDGVWCVAPTTTQSGMECREWEIQTPRRMTWWSTTTTTSRRPEIRGCGGSWSSEIGLCRVYRWSSWDHVSGIWISSTRPTHPHSGTSGSITVEQSRMCSEGNPSWVVAWLVVPPQLLYSS